MKFAESLEIHRQAFLESLRVRNFSPATLASRGQSLDAFFRFLSSRQIEDVREVSTELIRDYQLFLSEQPWTTHTLHAKLMALRQFFRHLEKTDAVLLNPCCKMVLPKLADRLPRNVLTPAEARRILDQPDTQTRKGIRDKAILEVFYSTGIRLEEMSNLTTHDVDTRNGFLRVNKGKFAKDRVAPVGRKACDYVREYLAKVRAVWSRERRDERALWLSAYAPHRPLKKQLIEVMVKEYGRKAGLDKRVTPHVWRHTCATHLVANGSNIAYVQRLLGHRSLETTQIYTRVSATDIRRAVRRSHPRALSRSPLQSASADKPPTSDHDAAPRFFSRSL